MLQSVDGEDTYISVELCSFDGSDVSEQLESFWLGLFLHERLRWNLQKRKQILTTVQLMGGSSV